METKRTFFATQDKPLHEYLREHARRHPDKAAYIWYGRAISFAELDRASDEIRVLLVSADGSEVHSSNLEEQIERAQAAEVHAVIVTVFLVHLAGLRVLERGQLGHHLGHRRPGHRRLGHLSLLPVTCATQPTRKARSTR